MRTRCSNPAKPIFADAAIFLLCLTTTASAAPQAELWARWQAHDPTSTESIDHASWDAFLAAYVLDQHPSGINRVRYNAVTARDRSKLREYLERMQAMPISQFNRREQLAYWINLYNAGTVNIVLEHFPVGSIRDINLSSGFFSGLFGGGPWRTKLFAVEGEKISLDDIEHRILRPIWLDNRLHYAVNCASLGCPNLPKKAFTAKNTEGLLQDGAHAYINHPRGVSMLHGKLRLSKIYDWFREDFGNSTNHVLTHLQQHADPPLREQLQEYQGDVTYVYDWSLNDARGPDGT